MLRGEAGQSSTTQRASKSTTFTATPPAATTPATAAPSTSATPSRIERYLRSNEAGSGACTSLTYAYGGAIYANVDDVALSNRRSDNGDLVLPRGRRRDVFAAFTLSGDPLRATRPSRPAPSSSDADAYGGAIYGTGSTLASTNDTFGRTQRRLKAAAAEADGGAIDASAGTFPAARYVYVERPPAPADRRSSPAARSAARQAAIRGDAFTEFGARAAIVWRCRHTDAPRSIDASSFSERGERNHC